MYNFNCNKSPIMLALSSLAEQTDFNKKKKNIVSKIYIHHGSCTSRSVDLMKESKEDP